MRAFPVALIGVLTLALEASSQTLRIESTARDSAASLTQALLERGTYQVMDRDTLLGPDEVIPGDVVILRARVTLEGRIAGSVSVIDGEFFVRPRATVEGPIAVLGPGGAFVSGLATVESPVYGDPRNRVLVTGSANELTVRVLSPPAPSPLRLPNIIGLDLPSYDRVNGLTLTWGPALRIGGRDTATVTVRPTVSFHAGREDFGGGIDIRLRPSPRSMVIARAGRASRTPDGWIRGTLPNSLSSLLLQSDTRDYFESDEVSLTIARTPPPPLIQGESYIAPSLTLRASRDRSLAAADPWSLFDDDEGWRDNPSIDEGELVSLVVSAVAGWRGATSTFSGVVATEWAPPGIGDFEFAQLSLNAFFGMQALWNHRIGVSVYYLQPLGGNEAPLQRWSHVGGPGTLSTLPDVAMRGDHVVFVESIYLAPIPGVTLPLIGEPAVRLEHAAGAAWLSGDDIPRFEQNLAGGLQASLFHAVVVTDPGAAELRFRLRVGVEVPMGGGLATFPFF